MLLSLPIYKKKGYFNSKNAEGLHCIIHATKNVKSLLKGGMKSRGNGEEFYKFRIL